MATARQFYGGRLLITGDQFEADERQADDLCAVGFARRLPRAPAPPVVVAPVVVPVAAPVVAAPAAAPDESIAAWSKISPASGSGFVAESSSAQDPIAFDAPGVTVAVPSLAVP